MPTDAIYAVDSRFVGIAGRRLPWAWRYVDYAVSLPVFVLLLQVYRFFGFSISVVGLGYVVAATVLVVWLVSRVVVADRPLTSLVVTLWHEVGGPRARRVRRLVFDLSRVRVREEMSVRGHLRSGD